MTDEAKGPFWLGQDDMIRVPSGKVLLVIQNDKQWLVDWLNKAYALGLEAGRKEVEVQKMINDAVIHGEGHMLGEKHVPHEEIYLSEAEMKVKALKAAGDKMKIALENAKHWMEPVVDGFGISANTPVRTEVLEPAKQALSDWQKARGE